MTRYPKRLIEVDLPIARISAHVRREKSIRHGHISTLHIWWARRPLAACRAVICAALWPDPADELCPPAFREAAVEQITSFANRVFPKKITEEGRLLQSEKHLSRESRGRWEAIAEGTLTLDAKEPGDWGILRLCLLDFIADFANWDNNTVPAYLETSRALTQAAHEGLGGAPGTRPLVVDPFAGGGAIPLEGLRVGADTFASDLNPVAVLLNKVMLEYIPKYGQQLADEVRKWGQWVKEQAEQELAQLYPKDPDGATPVAYLWARTIRCEGPRCGVEIPLIRSLWITKKGNNSVGLTLQASETNARIDFRILQHATKRDIRDGTIRRGSATCPMCKYTTPVESVRRQLVPRHGGVADARLISVVLSRPSEKGRFYRVASESDHDAIRRVLSAYKNRADVGKLSEIPDEPLPDVGALGFRVQRYGVTRWGDVFSPRQSLALSTIAGSIRKVGPRIVDGGGELELSTAVQACLAIGLAAWQIDAPQFAHGIRRPQPAVFFIRLPGTPCLSSGTLRRVTP